MLSKENLNRTNFNWTEFFASDTTYRINHDENPYNDFVNYPPKGLEQSIFPCLMNTADMCQEFYDLLHKELYESCGPKSVIGFYVKILSGYRCEILNKIVKGQKNSLHLQGLAVDIICPKFGSPEKIMKFLYAKGFVVDQCLMEGSWLHISRKLVKSQNRMEYAYYLPNPKTGKREKIIYK